MSVRTAWISCLLAGTILFHCDGIKWLGSYNIKLYHHDMPSCESLMHKKKQYGLRRRHIELCRRKNGIMLHVRNASIWTLKECDETFMKRHWNCSSMYRVPRISRDLSQGMREQSIAYAFASVGLVLQFTHACSRGTIDYCECKKYPDVPLPKSKHVNESFKWGDCHANVEAAIELTRLFLGLSKKEKRFGRRRQNHGLTNSIRHRRIRGPRIKRSNPFFNNFGKRRGRKYRNRVRRRQMALINLHNYKAGIQIVKKMRRIICKCTGVSGSCNMRVCYHVLAPIPEVVLRQAMLNQYLGAIHVKVENGRLFKLKWNEENQPPEKDKLVYVKRSPDFCLPDRETGSVGTIGRKCILPGEPNTKLAFCQSLCCGRSYRSTIEPVTQVCNCGLVKFNIVCEKCTTFNDTHYCL